MTINITVPTSYEQLTQEQLRYVYFLLSTGHYEPDQVKALCLIRWGKLTNDQLEVLKPSQVAAFLPVMDYLLEVPDRPVRLTPLHGHEACHAQLQGVPFRNYLDLENLYQGYLHTQDGSLLNQMAGILYGAPMVLTPAEQYAVFVWFASVKKLFGVRFPHFFVQSPVEKEDKGSGATYNELRKAMNTQIRALTKGDITKEAEILAMDVWRALTELDAQAEEYNELKKISSQHGKK